MLRDMLPCASKLDFTYLTNNIIIIIIINQLCKCSMRKEIAYSTPYMCIV